MLGDGSRESGGRHDQVISTTLIPTLDHLADELLNQYALTYVVPDGVKLTDKLSVASKRPGVNANLVVDDAEVDGPSGTSVLNGVSVRVSPA